MWRPVISLICTSSCALTSFAGYVVAPGAPHVATADRAQLAGLSADATVTFDAYGVPHVEAKSLADAARVAGFVQARARFFQMDVLRRAARGRLSELVGDQLVGVHSAFVLDRTARALGIERRAEAAWATASAETRAQLEAFAAGVNTAREAHRRPLEYRVLQLESEPWSPIDTLSIFLLVSLSDAPVPRLLEGQWRAWVFASERGPVVVNEPNFTHSVPGTFVQQHLVAPGLDVIGATVPGIPWVLVGHSLTVAWGIESVPSRVHAVDAGESHSETVRVRDGAEVFERTVTVQPIVDWPEADVAASLEALLHLNQARTANEAATAASQISVLPVEWKLADADSQPADVLDGGAFEAIANSRTAAVKRDLQQLLSTVDGASVSEHAKPAWSLLAAWSGEATVESVEASLFFLTQHFAATASPLAAFERAVSFLRESLGPRPAAWRWGALHSLESRHVFGNKAVLAWVVNLERIERPGPPSGFASTDEQAPFRERIGPAYRDIVELRDVAHARWVVDTGSSGWSRTAHYGDQREPWSTGELVPMRGTGVGTLVLTP